MTPDATNHGFSYRDYVSDAEFMAGYRAYQQRYANKIRESDRLILQLVGDVVKDGSAGASDMALLDIGCSTGNLLLHLKQAFPTLRLTGGDMVQDVIDECRRNPQLKDIQFEIMNMLSIGRPGEFDIVTANAVLYMFADAEFDAALASVADALKPGGSFIAFDFFHPYEQDLSILEKSKTHPAGLALHFRPRTAVTQALRKHGFTSERYQEFQIPAQLPQPQDRDDISSYTVETKEMGRLIFRGSLYSPWCHLVAQRAS